MEYRTIINHWRYEDGYRQTYSPGIENEKFFDDELRGWHCWVYPSNKIDFEKWMKQNMKGKYDCTFRFNSGDPMYTVTITDDEDATLFKLTWM